MIVNVIGGTSLVLGFGALLMSWNMDARWACASALFFIAAAICFK